MSLDGLELFLPPVATWFRETHGAPTLPQSQAWPVIASGQSVLISAPTGSGKTLAAFLACLDQLWQNPKAAPGVRVLYLSPLKALNRDIARNLEAPLHGILAVAERQGGPLAPLSMAVRVGDTSTSDRRRQLRNPPDLLITTPESLHLLLTSRAREMLRSVTHVIVDEIHALCPNKRGVFLALLLERLEAICPSSFLRIGLSATQRPLDKVAQYLGGARMVRTATRSPRFEPRPVTIIDTGQGKPLDLEVIEPPRTLPGSIGGSVWPAIEHRLLDLIQTHRSTLVFANNRRVVERLTTRLNDLAETETESDDPDSEAPPPLARSHHGSLSQEQRRETEEALKRGDLAALVATASLELGIDMGAVDLVCQVESPGSIARGLQRVGRAGHIVGHSSKGRLLAKTAGDLLESAALARGMTRGEVETLRVPTNCLDILAQQLVACVAVDPWDVAGLFQVVRQSYPYRDLSPEAFESVLSLISGRFGLDSFRDLRPRISWDRVHNRLHPLPGTSQLALVGGGAIPDTGQYPLYLGDGGPKLGELDEEFVLERRVGESFVLGSSSWRIEIIEPHRVLVSPANGQPALTPFWRGEGAGRTAELGTIVGELSRELSRRIDDPEVLAWLVQEYRLDKGSARRLREYVARQLRHVGAVPDDRTVVVETFRDQAGECNLAVLTPFGGRLHQGLKLALQARLRERLGIQVACLHADDGLLFRLPGVEGPPLDLFDGLTSERAEQYLRAELGESALFGLRFRQNASRALLMPRPDPSKRTPLWLQRLRAKDLLQITRQVPDFPIVLETYRECLDDDLDLPHLRAFLDAVQAGTIRVVCHQGEIPSPFASELYLPFTTKYLYEWDEPKQTDSSKHGTPGVSSLLDAILTPDALTPWLDPIAIERVESRLRGRSHPPRTLDEMAEALRQLGDLTPTELFGPMSSFLDALATEGRAVSIELDGTEEPRRWISAEDVPLYQTAFDFGPDPSNSDHRIESTRDDACSTIVRRFLSTRALIGLDDLTRRYLIDIGHATELLERWVEAGDLVRIDSEADGPSQWGDRRNLLEARRFAIARRRKESIAVTPERFADFVARRQHVHPETRREGQAALEQTLEQLQGFACSAETWELDVLPARVKDYRPAWLAEVFSSGHWLWRASGTRQGAPSIAILPRDFEGRFVAPADLDERSDAERLLLDHLRNRGASFVADLAQETALEPSNVRLALDGLLRAGLVTNDRFEPLRPEARARLEALTSAHASTRAPGSRLLKPRRGRIHSSTPEGRWWLLDERTPNDDDSTLAWVAALLGRYGILTRELVEREPFAPPWRELFPVLDQAELRGELRRGYFVEGLSGIQYALPEAAEALAHDGNQTRHSCPTLLSTLDPACLYGSGSAFDIPLLNGGTARLPRLASNSIVQLDGRPVLIIEGNGLRLTGLASASEPELKSALGLLPVLARPPRRILKIDTYNSASVLTSPIAGTLQELGFVRTPPGLTYYARIS